VLQAVDDALRSASEAGTKTSEEADENIEWAADMLHGYETEFRPGSDTGRFRKKLAEAKEKDWIALNTHYETLLKQVRFRHANFSLCLYQISGFSAGLRTNNYCRVPYLQVPP
jgi:hypothetical protein